MAVEDGFYFGLVDSLHLINRRCKILLGCGTSRPPIWQQDMGHIPAGNGVIGRVLHQSCVANGTETQTAAGPSEGMGLSKVGGCFDGVRDEDNSGVHSDLPADNRGVRCN